MTPPKPFPVGFWSWAQEFPDRLALVTPDEKQVSAGDLLASANQIAHGLRALGLKKGDDVALLLGNGEAFVQTALATAQIGLYLTPISYHLVGPEVAYILENCEARVFITESAYAEAARHAVKETGFDATRSFSVGSAAGFRPFEELGKGQPTGLPPDRTTGQSMLYTSGTTGRPKGVRPPLPDLPPEQTAQLALLAASVFGLTPGEGTHIVTGPLYHAAPGGFGMISLHLGQALVLMQKWDAEDTLRLIEKYKVTAGHLVPTMFHRMLALPDDEKSKYDVSTLKNILHGAAPCPQDVKKRMIDWWGPVIYEYYGATEGGGTTVNSKDWLDHPGTVGKAAPGFVVKVFDDEGKELPAEEIGTIYMKSPIGDLFEYFKDKEKTEKSRHQGMITVGDVGYLDKEGYLFLSDRKADMIISGGVNIYCAEIEAAFLNHPKVGDVAVFGIPDEDWGEAVKAVVEPAKGIQGSEKLALELMDHIRGQLAKFKHPRSIDFIDELPRQSSGKLYKRFLREKYWKGRDKKI